MKVASKIKSMSLKEKRRLAAQSMNKNAHYIPGGQRWKRRTR
ncbi:MAG: hypothetical protein WC178_03660 [Candidatus Paceibacterota bacterium]